MAGDDKRWLPLDGMMTKCYRCGGTSMAFTSASSFDDLEDGDEVKCMDCDCTGKVELWFNDDGSPSLAWNPPCAKCVTKEKMV